MTGTNEVYGEDSDKKIVYNYFAQDYSLVSKNRAGPDLFASLSELLPWSQGEQQALAFLDKESPTWRTSAFGPSDEAGLRRSFRAIAAAAGNEEAALEALRRNRAVILFGQGQIRAAGEVLVKALGRERATEVILKNPGVLTIDPDRLRENMVSVTAAAEVIDLILRNTGPAKSIFTLVQLAVAVSLGKAVFDLVQLRLLSGAGGP